MPVMDGIAASAAIIRNERGQSRDYPEGLPSSHLTADAEPQTNEKIINVRGMDESGH